jgi:two-component system invasion response regulator UvrY
VFTQTFSHEQRHHHNIHMLRILIADDHEIVRRGIKQILLEGLMNPEIGEAHDTPSLVQKALQEEWDIIISDLSMPGGGGMAAIPRIREVKPAQRILIVSIYPEEQYAVKVIRLGAAGYLNKDAATEELLKAVHVILAGRRYIQPLVAEKITIPLRNQAGLLPHELLSDREFEVLSRLVAGNSVTEIATDLTLSPNTVSTYRSRILMKMDMRSNADLVRYALTNKLTNSEQADL